MAKRSTTEAKVCLAPDCEVALSCRGLCWKHYQQARNYVKAGKTTWETLEAKGMAKPAGPQGSPASTAWLRDGV